MHVIALLHHSLVIMGNIGRSLSLASSKCKQVGQFKVIHDKFTTDPYINEIFNYYQCLIKWLVHKIKINGEESNSQQKQHCNYYVSEVLAALV